MTTLAARSSLVRLPLRLVRFVVDLMVGTLLCLSPLTAVLALGWLSRRMAARIGAGLGQSVEHPGWLLGARGGGWIVRLLGGLAANIRTGLRTAAGLAALTLPFTLLWAGAWWAGWENSFNKGYEQAAVGPAVWFIGAAMAGPVLAHLPLALAHASAEGRFGAFFEFRRIRSVFSAAGWRVVWLAVMSVVLSLPFFGMRALPVFVEGLVPGFAEMTPDAQAQVAQGFEFAGAALAFALVLFLRDRASGVYLRAVPRAAHGRQAAAWDNHAAQDVTPRGQAPSRFMAAVWLVLASAIWLALPVLIVMGQFMNYELILWLTHPVFLLPWAG